MKTKRYMIRITKNKIPFYLSSVSADGLRVRFVRNIGAGYVFTQRAVNRLRAKHPHIGGRLILAKPIVHVPDVDHVGEVKRRGPEAFPHVILETDWKPVPDSWSGDCKTN